MTDVVASSLVPDALAPHTERSFRLLADSLAQLFGYQAVLLSIRHDDDFVIVTRSARAEGGVVDGVDREIGARWPVDSLALAVPILGTTQWHRLPATWLVHPIVDTAGEVIGALGVSERRQERDPSGDQLRILEGYAMQATTFVRDIVESAKLTTQNRLATDLQHIVRAAARASTVEGVLDATVEPLTSAFPGTRAWIRLFAHDDTSALALHSDGITMRDPHMTISAHIAAPHLWREGGAAVIEKGQISNIDTRVVPADYLLGYLRRNGLTSMLFVPIGSADRCYGVFTLSRVDDASWSAEEYELAVEFGRDLGALIAAIGAIDRERRLVEELAQIDHYRDQLIAKVAHEFEHPLTAIIDQMGVLGTQVGGGAFDTRLTGVLRRDALRMQRLVDNLLLLSQLADPNRPLHRKPVELGGLVRRVADLLSAAISDRQVDLRLPLLPMNVNGDAMELERLVSNLLHNAMKFVPPHGEVSVSLRELGGEIELLVSDEGIGIEPDELPLVFDEFFRSADPAASIQPGAGLGLAIVRRVVQRHGAQIDVVSTPGEGSTFRVTFPIAIAE